MPVASPPDRSHDIAAITARRRETCEAIEPLVYRYNELADRKLRGPGTRNEMRDVREQITELSRALDRLTTELDEAHQEMALHDQFSVDHAPEAAFLDAVDHELERQMRKRARQIAADPTDYHSHVLGPVPVDSGHQAVWLRGATILERHFLGIDRDPTRPARSSVLGSPRENAEMHARLEVMAVRADREPVGRSVDTDLGLDQFD